VLPLETTQASVWLSPFSRTATELRVAFWAVTWMVASRPTPAAPSAGVTLTEGGLETVS